MVFLPDLSDGETSDGGAGRDNFDGPGRTSSGILNFDDELMTSAPNINNNNRHAGAGMFFSMLAKKNIFHVFIHYLVILVIVLTYCEKKLF